MTPASPDNDPLFGNPASDLLRGAMEDAPSATPASPWEPPAPEQLAALLPQYEIERMLGRGGMGAVYKGRQIALDRPVAVKILSNHLAGTDASFAGRFKNEARAMAKLSHPGIVTVYDFGEAAGGLLYIVMEFVEGTDVGAMIAQQGRLHSEHAMAITAHVCDALAYAHECGIIHRDIKPANIMLRNDGVVKVADFGLAKFSSEDGKTQGLTQSGMAIGTPHFVAPEALMHGMTLDHRADIYAVGVMLYQMLTGKLPQGLFELPSLQIPGLDPRYDAIIGKALRENREVRYPSVQDLRRDLDAILTQPVVKVEAGAEEAPAALTTRARSQRASSPPVRRPRPAQPPKSTRAGTYALVFLFVLLGATAVYFFGGVRKETGSSSASPVPSEGWRDLLALVDPETGTVSGKWTQIADGLHGERLPDGKGAQVLQLPFEPPEEYDFRVAFTTLEGNAEISQILSAAGSQFTWGTACGQPEKWAGFNRVNGKMMMQSGAGVKLPARRELNRRYESLVEVRRDRVTGYVDGEKLVEWKTDYSDLSMDPEYKLPNPRALGIGIWWSKTVFHEISVREVTGKGKMVPAGQPSVASDLESALLASEWTFENRDTKGVVWHADLAFKKNGTLKVSYKSGDQNTWHWWITGERTLHVQTSAEPATLDPKIGFEWTFDEALSSYSGRRNNYEEVQRGARKGSAPVPQTAKASSISPEAATKDQPFVNSLGMKFVPVPGTTILMCIHETRKADYAVYAAKNANVNESWKNPNYEGIPVSTGDDHPVCNVSWEDAAAFCDWLSKKEQRRYRLPTDHEWSMAVGIGGREDTRLTPGSLNEKIPGEYIWGTQWPPPKGVGNYADTAAKKAFPKLKTLDGYTDGFATSSPVMSFLPNTLGIYDLAGNVWEFCGDFFDKAQTMRTVRGGCWFDGGEFPRPFLATGRNGNKPWDRHNSRGFRCVLEADPAGDGAEATPARDSAKVLPETGFIPLLEAPHLAAWKEHGHGGGVALSDGVVTLKPARHFSGAWWYDKRTFSDFELRLQFRLASPGANSGVMLRFASADEKQDKHYYHVDISNDRNPLELTGAIMFAKAPASNPQKDGEWNDLEIITVGQSYRVGVNGIPVNDFTGSRATSGYIGFQLGRGIVQLRNIRIKDLAASPLSTPATVALPASQADASDPAKAAKEQPFVNSLGMKFVPVPGTNTLFCIHETRKADYAAFAAANPGLTNFWRNTIYQDMPVSFADDHPVCNISWQECRDFCQWLSRKEGRTYRLPTDREWSFAVGIGDREDASVSPHHLSDRLTGEFPWGNEWPPPSGAGNLGDTIMGAKFPKRRIIPGYTDGFATTAPVMSFTPNPFGLYDLSGNVWEFCEDWYDETQTTHVIRGLNFDDGGDSSVRFLSSHRGWCPAPNRHANHGFRVVLER